ncbi:efflux RND transporter periplasmic adaptor subunit [Acidocella sp. KAb 2-4]|uniref:efflux RND transporter periplasmic adaptor subunit n=1 Tax=Acidocella sp. KAb 2-4 TaxID=2885158 RepID=UPI001D07A6DE|nr:efflux RND transporter periplasmic adaptor subunit [Acidocella sp. KAb 2-4]MCB5944919.1 efflux RND transporter periplasmic adaptor subunit [Acidocella sp. KAb 2-4]
MSKPNVKFRMAVMLAGLAVLFGLVFGYGALRGYFIAQFLKSYANQVQTVATITAAPSPWQPQLQSVGSLTAFNGAALSAEIGGIVDTIDFDSGADVKKGQLLLTLRPNNDPAVLAQLQANAQLAALTYARDQKQFAANAVSRAQLDSDRANLDAARAQVAAQQALMAEKQIRAPFSGRLGIRQVDVGQYLSPGTAIVTLEQLNPLYVDFYLPQQALAQVQVGQRVDVSVDAYPGQDFTGTISAIGASIDQATRSVAVRATITNDKLQLRPGMFASLNISVGTPAEYITLPQTAIAYNSYGDTVFLVRHGKDANGKPTLVADQVFVQLGATRGDQVQVLSGLQPGDVVVTAGQMKLRKGVLVAINNTIQPANDANPAPPNE